MRFSNALVAATALLALNGCGNTTAVSARTNADTVLDCGVAGTAVAAPNGAYVCQYVVDPGATDRQPAIASGEHITHAKYDVAFESNQVHRYHQILTPQSATPCGPGLAPPACVKGIVLFLGGSESNATYYNTLSAEVASQGYIVINLSYENQYLVGAACAKVGPGLTDSCFTNIRGGSLFGDGVAYASGPYGLDGSDVGPENAEIDLLNPDGSTTVTVEARTGTDPVQSVTNRLVSLLEYLKNTDGYMTDAAGTSFLWGQYLVYDTTSPYPASADPAHPVSQIRLAYPAWSKFIVSGHSQGGGDAAFVGTRLGVRRIVLFSSPDDNVAGAPATWIASYDASAIDALNPKARWWGLRDVYEGSFGACTSQNWQQLWTGTYSGGCGDGITSSLERDLGWPWSSTILANTTKHFLDIDFNSTSSLEDHDESATDPTLAPVWDYLFP